MVHLFLVDYDYANGGWDPSPAIEANYSESEKNPQPVPFRGGALALNASLLSTTLLASRLSSDISAFLLLLYSVLMFGLYPAARHDLSKISRSRRSMVNQHDSRGFAKSKSCLVSHLDIILTGFVVFSTFGVLSYREAYFADDPGFVIFFGLLVVFCIISPFLTWHLSQFKNVVRGPWDIAKMDLDHRNVMSKTSKTQ